jgi:uncharacterized membrane protein YeaQ/YmgE (transglycosylase-associated protein family)
MTNKDFIMSKLDKDTLSNFTVALLITQVVGDLVYLFTQSFYGGAIFAILSGLGAGILKELYDAYINYSDVNIRSIIASVLGCLIGALLVIVVLIK